jgi:gas vesicle protein
MKKLLFVLGTGVVIGLLIAPEKGSDTWKKLMDGLDDIKDKAEDEINSLVGKGKSLFAKGQNKAQTISKEW